jgi:LPPG:FO 2-phospho-L-lactate transferase
MNQKLENRNQKLVVLTGGTGGAKFVQGLVRAVAPESVTVIVNTGDDLTWWGLHVSPDIDSILYALSGLLSRERGWGVDGDTFTCLERMKKLGASSWFQLGDRDLATHFRRTALLATHKLTEVTTELASKMGIRSRVLPMTNDRVETLVSTSKGELSFQEYFVRERYSVPVSGVRFEGAGSARPAPGVDEAIRDADAIFIAPSNPITSIGPILAVPGIREALRTTDTQIAAISPIVGGAAVSGPAGELMKMRGLPVSYAGVAQAYEDFVDVVVADESDRTSLTEDNIVRSSDSGRSSIRVVFAKTIMSSDDAKTALARVALASITLAGSAQHR